MKMCLLTHFYELACSMWMLNRKVTDELLCYWHVIRLFDNRNHVNLSANKTPLVQCINDHQNFHTKSLCMERWLITKVNVVSCQCLLVYVKSALANECCSGIQEKEHRSLWKMFVNVIILYVPIVKKNKNVAGISNSVKIRKSQMPKERFHFESLWPFFLLIISANVSVMEDKHRYGGIHLTLLCAFRS